MEAIVLMSSHAIHNACSGIRVLCCACAVLVAIGTAPPAAGQPRGSALRCQPAGPAAAVPDLSEASGLAVSFV